MRFFETATWLLTRWPSAELVGLDGTSGIMGLRRNGFKDFPSGAFAGKFLTFRCTLRAAAAASQLRCGHGEVGSMCATP
jgi:hypothetical protein